jgi:hypothetical protein
MSKKKQAASEKSNAMPKNELAFIVRKLSLQEWQVIELTIEGDEIVKRVEREPDVAAIVGSKLMNEIRKFNT